MATPNAAAKPNAVTATAALVKLILKLAIRNAPPSAHRAFEHITDAQVVPDLLHIDSPALVCKG